jgi:hypothetical protein
MNNIREFSNASTDASADASADASTKSELERLFDTIPDISTQQVIDAVRDSIDAGLITEDRDIFEDKVRSLDGLQLEGYLQELWDEI